MLKLLKHISFYNQWNNHLATSTSLYIYLKKIFVRKPNMYNIYIIPFTSRILYLLNIKEMLLKLKI